jgi:glycerol-3-phosphate acyltransferase PlsY
LIPWGAIATLTVLATVIFIVRDSPFGVILGIAILPVVSYVFKDPLAMNLGFLAIFIIAIIARLASPRSSLSKSVTPRQLALNRFLFDRDVRDKEIWMNRLPG